MSGEERPTLFLIAHKVRGEPAFDIATREEVEGEEMWIIPTSGHRAYPWWWVELTNIDDTYELEFKDHTIIIDATRNIFGKMNGPPSMPPDLPDHYSTLASPRTADPTAARNLLSSLGLIKPAEPIKRRI